MLGICGGLSFLYGCGGGKSKKRFNRSISLLTWPVSGHLILTFPRHLKLLLERARTMLKRFWIALLLPVLLLLAPPDGKAQTGGGTIGGVSNGDIAGAIAGVAAAGAAGAIILVHEHNVHTLKGCVSSDAGGLRMENAGDKRSYALTGDTAGIKSGERVKLSGKKMKGNKDHPQFAVSKLTKDYGACKL